MTEIIELSNGDTVEPGTWLSGTMGWHNGYRAVETAEHHGFTVPEEYREAWAAFNATREDGGEPDYDSWADANGDDGGLVDKATDYLESLLPEGWTFEWDMGELSLVSEWTACANAGGGCEVDWERDDRGNMREIVRRCPEHNPCPGHHDTDDALTSGVGAGEPVYCDGSCQS